MGDRYAEPVLLDLEATWGESDPRTPLICFLSMGSDPTNQIDGLARKRGIGKTTIKLHMSHFAYACKMRCPLNLVLENSEYLWFYWTFCIVILDYGLKLHKLSNHTLAILQKWLEIHKIIVWSTHCILFSAIFVTEKFPKKCQHFL